MAELSKKREQILTLCEKETIDQDHVILTFLSADIASTAQPGQFVNLSCSAFLRRPFGILSVDPESGQFQVGIRRQGTGSNELADLPVGSRVSALGPLGHGFDLSTNRQVITVGGGTGVFPLLFVHQVCRDRGIAHHAVCGYRDRDHALLMDHFELLAESCIFASDEGGLDMTGTANDALHQVLSIMDEAEKAETVVMACGPTAMLKGIAETCAHEGVDCEVSLEERMACGIGVCLCCTVETDHDGQRHHDRCCVEGPVFSAMEVRWS